VSRGRAKRRVMSQRITLVVTLQPFSVYIYIYIYPPVIQQIFSTQSNQSFQLSTFGYPPIQSPQAGTQLATLGPVWNGFSSSWVGGPPPPTNFRLYDLHNVPPIPLISLSTSFCSVSASTATATPNAQRPRHGSPLG
jgi:hypothetical protein